MIIVKIDDEICVRTDTASVDGLAVCDHISIHSCLYARYSPASTAFKITNKKKNIFLPILNHPITPPHHRPTLSPPLTPPPPSPLHLLDPPPHHPTLKIKPPLPPPSHPPPPSPPFPLSPPPPPRPPPSLPPLPPPPNCTPPHHCLCHDTFPDYGVCVETDLLPVIPTASLFFRRHNRLIARATVLMTNMPHQLPTKLSKRKKGGGGGVRLPCCS